MGQKVYSSLKELFQDVRRHCRESGDPAYQPIGPRKDLSGNFNAQHAVPWDCHLRYNGQFVPVQRGAEIVLYQDPELSDLKSDRSVGTLYLPNDQLTLRGNDTISRVDLVKRRTRALCSSGTTGRSRGKSAPADDYGR